MQLLNLLQDSYKKIYNQLSVLIVLLIFMFQIILHEAYCPIAAKINE